VKYSKEFMSIIDDLGKTLLSRKTPHQKRVEQMMNRIREIGKLPALPSAPTVPDAKMLLAQAKLVFEECMELLEACGIEVHISATDHCDEDGGLDVVKERKNFLLSIKEEPHVVDPVEVAKEAADVSVVTTGLLSEFGIADASVLEAVDANNLGKFDPARGGYLDENRKWRKPQDYEKPDIEGILVGQGWKKEGVDGEANTGLQEVPVPSRDDGQERPTEEAPG
jgi:predicted HAD superfamily Cof-like phosphohydrolase